MRGDNNFRLIKTVRQANTEMQARFGVITSRSLKVSGAAGSAMLVFGFAKLILGIISFSLSTCVSAFYTLGMVYARYTAMTGLMKTEKEDEQYRYYSRSGIILVVASLLFVGYSIWLLFYPATASYHMYIAIAIAAFTFAELTISIRGVIIERQNRLMLFHAIRTINLASSLVCLVLTQTAILSFADMQVELHPFVNSLIGIIMGSAATLLGAGMIVRIQRISSGRNYREVFRKVKKLMREDAIYHKMKPVRYIVSDERVPVLKVKLIDNIPPEEFEMIKANVLKKLQVEIDSNPKGGNKK